MPLSTTVSTSLSIMMLLCASLAMAAPQTHASKNAKKTATAPISAVDDGEDEGTPDTTASIAINYQCELGNKLTIFTNAEDDKHIALRWGKTLHRLTRMPTTTGANRFENRKYGLLWIGIPAKGILLDSRKGQQLANECKSPEQEQAPATVSTDVTNG